MRERREQEERPGPVAGEVPELPHRPEGDLLVVVDLQRRLARPSVKHGREVVVPGQPLARRQRPVGDPVEAGRVDVGRQPFLEAVQLVRPDEVHLPGKAGRVAAVAQMVRHGGDGRR